MREPLRGVNGSGSFEFTPRLGLAGRVGQLPGFDGVVVLVDLVIIDVASIGLVHVLEVVVGFGFPQGGIESTKDWKRYKSSQQHM
jgi:hypothetical protein